MKKSLVGIIGLILFSGIGLLLAANQGYFGYGVSNTLSRATLNSSSAKVSTSVSKVEEWGVCKTVASTDARLLFIPTKTTTERSTFITNKPSHITLGTCGCTTNADCPSGTCVGYIPPTANVCNGTYNVLGWQFNNSEFLSSLYEIEEHGCVENITQTPSNPAMPSYAPTSIGQIANQTTICWQGDFYIACNYYNNPVSDCDNVRWEAVVTSTPSCSSFNQITCQSTTGCDWAPGTPETLGTCVVCGVWGAWSTCSVTCGGGTQSRTDNCGNTESRACNIQACPVCSTWGDCVVGTYTYYGNYGGCDSGAERDQKDYTCTYNNITIECSFEYGIQEPCNPPQTRCYGTPFLYNCP